MECIWNSFINYLSGLTKIWQNKLKEINNPISQYFSLKDLFLYSGTLEERMMLRKWGFHENVSSLRFGSGFNVAAVSLTCSHPLWNTETLIRPFSPFLLIPNETDDVRTFQRSCSDKESELVSCAVTLRFLQTLQISVAEHVSLQKRKK